jgi:hypothetical protein
VPRIPYTDLGGGLNQGKPPSGIKDNEQIAISNFYPFAGKLIRRGGHRKLNTGGAYAEQLTGIFPYRPEGSTEVTTILGGLTTIAKLDGEDITAIAPAVGFTVGSSTDPWTMFEYKDIMYAFRKSSNQLIRCDGTYYGSAGITAPSAACTIAEGAAGDIPAAGWGHPGGRLLRSLHLLQLRHERRVQPLHCQRQADPRRDEEDRLDRDHRVHQPAGERAAAVSDPAQQPDPAQQHG